MTFEIKLVYETDEKRLVTLYKNKMGDYPGANCDIERNPDKTTGQWKEFIKRETRIHDKHIAIRGNGTDVWPGEPEPNRQKVSYFDNIKKREKSSSLYDRMFHEPEGYNSRLHRDDRQHNVGLDVQAEERCREVPVCSSAMYGRLVHQPLEDTSIREHVRINHVMKSFCRSSGTGIPTAASLREPNHPMT